MPCVFFLLNSPKSELEEKSANSLVITITDSPQLKRSSSQSSGMGDKESSSEEISDRKPTHSLRRDSSDPNLTLISLFSPNTPPNIQVNVQRSSGKQRSSHLFSLFKLPKRPNNESTVSETQSLQTVEGNLSGGKLDTNKSTVETTRDQPEGRAHRFISFVRYIFCQFVPIGSNAVVAPANENSTTDNKQASSTAQSRVKKIF